jgi:hypothetical protein
MRSQHVAENMKNKFKKLSKSGMPGVFSHINMDTSDITVYLHVVHVMERKQKTV